MWRVRRDVAEELLPILTLLAHPPHRFVEVDVGAVALELPLLPLVHEDRVGVLALSADGVARLPDPAAAVDDGALEALIQGTHRLAVTEVPLAEDPCTPSRLLHHLSDRHLLRLQHRPTDIGVEGARTLGVPARHQRRSRRGTDRVHIKLRQARTLPCETVEVRRLKDGVSVHGEVPPALVIRHYDDDVRGL